MIKCVYEDGVVWEDMHPKIEFAKKIFSDVFEEYGVDFVITSARDGKHMVGSKHYEGAAFDTRTKNIVSDFNGVKKFDRFKGQMIFDEIKRRLGNGYDFLDKRLNKNGTWRDIQYWHVEWDPK